MFQTNSLCIDPDDTSSAVGMLECNLNLRNPTAVGYEGAV